MLKALKITNSDETYVTFSESEDQYTAVRTSGSASQKVHLTATSFSSAFCGSGAYRPRIVEGSVNRKQLCKKCFPQFAK